MNCPHCTTDIGGEVPPGAMVLCPSCRVHFIAGQSTTLGALIAAGALEDQAMACSIQRSLASRANEFFEFGRFEGAIGHFHRALHTAIDAGAAGSRA